jgi:hypothetical protein
MESASLQQLQGLKDGMFVFTHFNDVVTRLSQFQVFSPASVNEKYSPDRKEPLYHGSIQLFRRQNSAGGEGEKGPSQIHALSTATLEIQQLLLTEGTGLIKYRQLKLLTLSVS